MKGGSIFSSLAGLATKALPTVTKAASHILPGLAQGVGSALASLGIDKLFGGSIYLEPENLPYIKPYLNQFTPEQLTAIHDASQSGRGLQIDLSPEQQTGGFLGALLGAIGIPLVVKALTGSNLDGEGLQIRCGGGAQKGKGLRILTPQSTQEHFERQIMLANKKKGKGLLLGKNSPFKDVPLLHLLL